MQTKPVVKTTLTVADLKHQPGMVVQSDIKAGYIRKNLCRDAGLFCTPKEWINMLGL